MYQYAPEETFERPKGRMFRKHAETMFGFESRAKARTLLLTSEAMMQNAAISQEES